MITDISIRNYRGIAKADLAGLRPFSVFTGANNAGKTTVMEAMAAHHEMMKSPRSVARLMSVIIGHRRLPAEQFDSLRLDPTQYASVRVGQLEIDIGPRNGTQAVFSDKHGAVNLHAYEVESAGMSYRSPTCCFVAAPLSAEPTAIETAWSDAVRRGNSRDVLAGATALDPTIQNLQLILESGKPVLYAESDVGGAVRAWPVAAGGSGFKRLLLLVAEVAGADGLVCIDDPDAFLHPGMFRHLAKLLWGLVAKGTQVVVATHNVELIDTLAEDINGPPESDQFGVFGFVRDAKGELTCALRLHGATAQLPKRRDAIRQLLGL